MLRGRLLVFYSPDMQPGRQNAVDCAGLRSTFLREVLLGLVVGLVVLAAGVVLLVRLPVTYEASTSLIVMPDSSLSPGLVAGYYDTLSQGQVVNTFAEVLRVRAAGSDLPAKAGSSVKVSVQVVPNTAVIQITGSARTPAGAVDAAQNVLPSTALFVNQAYAPYRIALVRSAQGTAHRVGLGRAPVLAVVALVALVAGLAIQQAARALNAAARRRTAVRRAEQSDADRPGGAGTGRAAQMPATLVAPEAAPTTLVAPEAAPTTLVAPEAAPQATFR